MGRNAQERRKARKVKAEARSRSRLPAEGPVFVVADHRESVVGWTSELIAEAPGGTVAAQVGPYPSVRETFRAAMAQVRILADEHGSAMTVHELDGSAERWAVLAAREGLADDAGCDCGECRAAFVSL
jgi:hypothetical protein